jgi:hypothetical protein
LEVVIEMLETLNEASSVAQYERTRMSKTTDFMVKLIAFDAGRENWTSEYE